MANRHRADADFWKHYDALPREVRQRADKAVELLRQNPQHPSPRFKKVGKKWSARVDRGYRAIAVETDEGLIWTWIGSHDEYMREIDT
jgi:hypothetical protein